MSRVITGTESQVRNLSVHHVAVQTRDWEESRAFYRDVLGMRIIADFGEPERKLCLLEAPGGGHIELYGPSETSPRDPGSSRSDPFVHIALGTPDPRASIESMRALGYEITYEPREISIGSLDTVIAFFRGPNGESIEFFEIRER